MATSLERSETKVIIVHDHISTIGENLMKIVPVDPEIIGLKELIKNK